MSDLTYLEEPHLALAPGALGGLVITATVARPYENTGAALTLVRDRLPMVTDVDWPKATIELRRVGRRHRYTLFVPPLVGPTPGPGFSADDTPASAALPLAGDSTDDPADAAMRDAVTQRLRIVAADGVPAELRDDVCTAFACLARWAVIPVGDRRALYGLSERLMQRSAQLSNPYPPVEE